MYLNICFHAVEVSSPNTSNKDLYEESDDEETSEFISRRNLIRMDTVIIVDYCLLYLITIDLVSSVRKLIEYCITGERRRQKTTESIILANIITKHTRMEVYNYSQLKFHR